MKYFLLLFCTLLFSINLKAQKVDSIYFHLYTDSLKKGQHNYINVDGKLSNGNWLPLTSKEILFSSSEGSFQGNDLFLPFDFKADSVKVCAVLKSNPAIKKEVTIYIKKTEDPELKTAAELFDNPKRKNKKQL